MGADLNKAINPQGHPDFERVAGVKNDFSSTTPVVDGGTFSSPIVYIEGYQYVISELEADRNCTLQFQWYGDQAGTRLLASVSFSFTAGSGSITPWTSVEGPFLRVVVVNSSGANMTRFWHRLRFTNQPLMAEDIAGLNTLLTAIQTEVNDELLATRNHITSDGVITRTQIGLVGTEINDEALAIRNHITSDGALTRTSIAAVETDVEANTTQLIAVNSALGTLNTSVLAVQTEVNDELATTRATVESVGEEIETALAIQHPRIIRHAYDQIGVDAGGRIRVSQFTTLMDGKVVNGHTSLIFESAGTGTFSLGSSKNNMSVTSGQWCVFQTRRFYPYFSGKSQAIEETFDGFAPEANVVKRFGYFSSSATSPFDTVFDGMWCESDGTTINLRMARAGTSTLNIPITSWSGYANLGEYQNLVNWNNFTVCLFDFLWLGGAVMRFWVKTQSGFVLAHVFNYAGTAQDVFMLCPCHPVRYEIRSTTGSGSFRYICSQVATEGSFEEDGIVRATTTGVSAITCATSGTVYPLIALRKQSAFRGVASRISDFNLFVTSPNDQLLYTIQINPTLSAPLTYGNVANSSMQSAIGNGTITVTAEGTVMASGFLTQNSILPTSLLQNNFLSYMGGTLANVMDEYVLCATPLSGVTNAATYASMAYKEY